MESIKFIKGYNKVNPSENPTPPNRHRKIIIAIFSAIFSTLLIASLLALFTQTSPSKLTPNSPIQTICAVTRYPDSCFSSLSPLNTNDPLHYFNLSLNVSISEVTKLAGSTDLKECVELLDDSVSQLAKSAELMRVKRPVLTEMRVSDLVTWISAAMSDVETCVDSMEEVGSNEVDELKVKVQRAQEYMSNTLAILSNVKGLYQKLGLNMP